MIFGIYKKFKNQNLNRFIIKAKIEVSMLGESTYITYTSYILCTLHKYMYLIYYTILTNNIYFLIR